MKSSKFKVQGSKLETGVRRSSCGKIKAFALLLLLLAAHCSLLAVFAHEGEDHSSDKKTQTTTTAAASAIAVARAERNVETDAGQFNVRLERVPADPRTGENALFAVRIAEKVEGGFGANEPVALEDAVVSANVTTADGTIVAGNLPTRFENGFYRGSYAFGDAGNFKIVFNAATSDGRNLSVDFPVSVSKALINWTFWLGLALLGLLAAGAIGAVF